MAEAHVLKRPLNEWAIAPAHTEREHIYTVDGVNLPSVSTILKCLDKPALVPWAAAQTVKKATELFARKCDKDGNLYMPFSAALEVLEEAKKKYRETSSDARDIGTIVHAYIESVLLGETPVPVTDENVALGLGAYTTWKETNHVKPVRVEAYVASKKYKFAGTVDFIGYVNGKMVIADWKTATGIYDEYKMQVSAYLACAEEMLAEKKQKFDGAYILRFDKKTGLFNPAKDCVYVSRTEALKYFRAFKGLLVYYYSMKK